MATKKHWKRKAGVDLPDDLDVLLAKLCVGAGFCNRLRGSDLVQEFPVLSADDFACAVLRAEGMDPDYYGEYREWIGRVFAERYGTAVSPTTYSGPRKFI